jgi:hypothetical protein
MIRSGATVAVCGGVAWVGLRKDQQAAMGVGPGDLVQVQIDRDDAPREVDFPGELAEVLAGSPEAAGRSPPRRIRTAGSTPRLARAAKAVTMLNEGVRSPD